MQCTDTYCGIKGVRSPLKGENNQTLSFLSNYAYLIFRCFKPNRERKAKAQDNISIFLKDLINSSIYSFEYSQISINRSSKYCVIQHQNFIYYGNIRETFKDIE